MLVWIYLLFLVSAEDQPFSMVVSSFPDISDIYKFEDSTRALLCTSDSIYFTKDMGVNWEQLFADEKFDFLRVLRDEHDNNMAFFNTEHKVFFTFDQGENWGSIDLETEIRWLDLQVNYANKDYALITIPGIKAENYAPIVFYSKDRLKTIQRVEIPDVSFCRFTKANPEFVLGADETIVCLQQQRNTFGFFESNSVFMTTDFFETTKNYPLEKSMVVDLSVVGPYVLMSVQVDRYALQSSTDLFFSVDGVEFIKAEFEGDENHWINFPKLYRSGTLYIEGLGKIDQSMSMANDVYKSTGSQYFKKVFSGVQNSINLLDGVWIANNFKNSVFSPQVTSSITFDDGMNWSPLKVIDDENCKIENNCSFHLEWVENEVGDDTPGIILAVGDTGEYLTTEMQDFKTFISRDGGISWRKVSDKYNQFAYGDLGNILIMIPSQGFLMFDDKPHFVDYFSYSLDQGDNWTDVKLDFKIEPRNFISNNDKTDKRFILVGRAENDEYLAVTIDFSDAFKDTCTDADMEDWITRVDSESGKQICVYGHSEKFKRRKKDAKCFVNKVYEDLKAIEEPCECTKEDTDCSFGFLHKNDECVPNVSILSSRYCKDTTSKIKLSSHQIVPGNLCQGGYKPQIDDYTLNCNSKDLPMEQPKILSTMSDLKDSIKYYQYFENDNTINKLQEDSLIILTEKGIIESSFDGGVSFSRVKTLPNKQFKRYEFNPYFYDQAFVVASDGYIYRTTDRGKTFTELTPPFIDATADSFRFVFRKSDEDTFIVISETNCDKSDGCKLRSVISKDGGITFEHFIDDVKNCYFADSIFDLTSYKVDEKIILCEVKLNDGTQFSKLVSTIDEFKTDPEIDFARIVGSSSKGKFLVIGQVTDEMQLKAWVSVNGENFAEAKFPHDYDDVKKVAYTVLDSKSGELFLHMTTGSESGKEFGALLKGNYNGTLFSTIYRAVNRNKDGFVDFEDVESLEGLQIANVVLDLPQGENPDKHLVSVISHNDGGSWQNIPAPKYDFDGNKINCKGCSLHLHSYTERIDPVRDTFGSSSALGMLFGQGNVGTMLSPLGNEDTGLYFSRDAGINWKHIQKGHWMWEFGDQGSLLLIANTDKPVKDVKYSLNMGDSWNDYRFSEDEFQVLDIATVPSDTSLKFMMIVKDTNGNHKIVNLDFTNVYPRQCDLEIRADGTISDGDYEYFIPKHPLLKGTCLFGHTTKLLRRKPQSNCFVGAAPLELGFKVEENCPCTREDYECDFNYELAIDGTCKLVQGLEGNKGDEVCQLQDADLWYEATGYRKLTSSTCQGGLILDKWTSHTCPGKSVPSEISGWGMFFIIFVPLLAFAGSLVFVYEKGIRRNGGFERFGQIRLDDDDNLQLIEENGTDRIVNFIVRFGVGSFRFFGRIVRAVQNRARLYSGYESVGSAGSVGAFFNDLVEDEGDGLFSEFNDDADADAREISHFGASEIDDEFDDFHTNDTEGFYLDEEL